MIVNPIHVKMPALVLTELMAMFALVRQGLKAKYVNKVSLMVILNGNVFQSYLQKHIIIYKNEHNASN